MELLDSTIKMYIDNIIDKDVDRGVYKDIDGNIDDKAINNIINKDVDRNINKNIASNLDSKYRKINSNTNSNIKDRNTNSNIKNIEDIFPIYYLIQLPKFSGIVKTKLYQWLYLLSTETVQENFDA